MSESQPNQFRIRTSVWHTDYLGDLLAEGVIDIDYVSVQEIFQEPPEEDIIIIRVGKEKSQETPESPYNAQLDDDEDENLDIF